MLCLTLSRDIRAEAFSVAFQSTATPPIWGPELPGDGMGGEIVKLLSEAADVRYSIDYIPVARFRRSAASYIVGDPAILTTKKSRFVFPIALFNSSLFYYKPHQAKPLRPQLQDLSGSRLGVLRGTVEDSNYFTSHGIRVEESDSIESLLRMLRKNRIDVCILIRLAGVYEIERIFLDDKNNFAEVAIPGTTRPIAIMLDADTAEGRAVAERYRAVMDKVLMSREYRDIIEKYYGDWGVPGNWFDALKEFEKSYAAGAAD
ncbi:substrate-binding periplasmic protein [Methylogaea oryzae]|uniref:substrate-binding periplasmic protein n=1 Tax=Methylogaea oryzae TaxID=1295382 RepID=UPI0006D1C410|nr:transporter substrate-binding domain-containing protein [Methylogaea oryzae]